MGREELSEMVNSGLLIGSLCSLLALGWDVSVPGHMCLSSQPPGVSPQQGC